MVGAAFALSAVAADVVVDGKDDTPYVVDGRNVVAISGADLCWRTGDWFPAAAASAMAGQHAAGCACDGDIAPKDKCVAPMTATTETKPASEPPPAATSPKAIRPSSKAPFDLNKPYSRPRARPPSTGKSLPGCRNSGVIRMITVSGYTDRTGSPPHNQQLSERRADAVKNYLVSKGINADRVETFGDGNMQPV